jgi:hypothetical protein
VVVAVVVVSVSQGKRGIHFNLTFREVADVVRLELGMYKSVRMTIVATNGCNFAVTADTWNLTWDESRLLRVAGNRCWGRLILVAEE